MSSQQQGWVEDSKAFQPITSPYPFDNLNQDFDASPASSSSPSDYSLNAHSQGWPTPESPHDELSDSTHINGLFSPLTVPMIPYTPISHTAMFQNPHSQPLSPITFPTQNSWVLDPSSPSVIPDGSFAPSTSSDLHATLTEYDSQGPSQRGSPYTQDLTQEEGDGIRYTHREQQGFFKDAHSLPRAPSWGPMIPQIMYRPHTNSDRRRYVEEVQLEAPIYFYTSTSGGDVCGISLQDALHSKVKQLHGRDETVFQQRGPSVSIRLEWPGYRQWSRQIPTKDFRSPPGPITKAKLAKNVAKCVQRFIEERHNHMLEDESAVKWRVGVNNNNRLVTNRITFDDLVLVSIHHVSMGSWQPQLRVIPRSFNAPLR
ncbi:hypothetical protein ONZ45_g6883 [Pleurotus djamor]|nr:hypothetical protein ONZ45_g6883 [Pleurotus djamor]